MYLEEIFDYIIVQTGQFLIGSDEVELDQTKFRKLVKTVLGTFNNYRPVSRIFHEDFIAQRFYTFTENHSPQGSEEVLGIPRQVTSVTPTEIFGAPAFNLLSQGYPNYGVGGHHGHGDPYALPGQHPVDSDLSEKSSFPWVYRKPTLWVPYATRCEIRAIYDHKIVEEEVDGVTKSKIATIDYSEEEFLEMLRGRFMMALASSRKAFTIGELPIETDAPEVYSEGRMLYQENKEALITSKSKFYEAYGD